MPKKKSPSAGAEALSAAEHYRRERERRMQRLRQQEDPIEAARRQYRALLAAEAEKGKGGRPRKSAAPAAAKRARVRSGEDGTEDDTPEE